MFNPMALLAFAAFVCVLISFAGKMPLSVAVLLLSLYVLLQSLPLGR